MYTSAEHHLRRDRRSRATRLKALDPVPRRIWTGGTAPTHLSSTWRRTGTREVSMTSFRARGTISRDTIKSGTRDRGRAAVHARRRPSHSSGEHGSAGRMLRTGSPHGLHAELGADKPKRAAVEAFDDRAGALRAAANDLHLCASEGHPPSTRGAQSRSSLFAARAEDPAVCSLNTRCLWGLRACPNSAIVNYSPPRSVRDAGELARGAGCQRAK